MLVYKKGDILQAKENLICHQVNENGVMGGGLALQIAKKYPDVERAYINFCKVAPSPLDLLGDSQPFQYEPGKWIVNCFTQQNFTTRLDLIRAVFHHLLYICKLLNYSIAIPYKYGCGIAKGNWEEVSKVFEELSNEYGIDISVYQLEE